jgi:epoxyqueuosine reductase
MPELSSLVTLTRSQFNERFKGSAVRRAKRDGFVRNVAVALGNSGDPAAVAPLSLALRDESALVRGHAAWALGRIGTAEAIDSLRQRLAAETAPDVIEEIRLALNERSA